MSDLLLNRAMTIRNPWAWAIINGGKDVENRSWQTDYRGPLYIHAGLAEPSEADRADPLLSKALENAASSNLDTRFRRGYVLGTVNLSSIHHANDCKTQANTMCSEWAHPGQYHWELTEARPLACPFPEKGKQGLWRF
ncbi:ASCH domain-containing protein [Pseudarthrobacter equi]|uniref:ASCH domain-containing protein n=1 Tax=Pseudarthrobacter equi TaxID=728066 RepID=UPI0021BEE591|nr:ASCH domain-containing protein [Pseudarthrobacter equi]MCT9624304.1 ASCH domain-containing protein [Pseudarthrobacter equi]